MKLFIISKEHTNPYNFGVQYHLVLVTCTFFKEMFIGILKGEKEVQRFYKLTQVPKNSYFLAFMHASMVFRSYFLKG